MLAEGARKFERLSLFDSCETVQSVVGDCVWLTVMVDESRGGSVQLSVFWLGNRPDEWRQRAPIPLSESQSHFKPHLL